MQPEELDDDLLQKLHHVLLEVCHMCIYIVYASLTIKLIDTRGRGCYGVPKLPAYLCDFERHPEHGLCHLCTVLFTLPELTHLCAASE
jgi:hypothetical protein